MEVLTSTLCNVPRQGADLVVEAQAAKVINAGSGDGDLGAIAVILPTFVREY